jgi:hypothetical protein
MSLKFKFINLLNYSSLLLKYFDAMFNNCHNTLTQQFFKGLPGKVNLNKLCKYSLKTISNAFSRSFNLLSSCFDYAYKIVRFTNTSNKKVYFHNFI